MNSLYLLNECVLFFNGKGLWRATEDVNDNINAASNVQVVGWASWLIMIATQSSVYSSFKLLHQQDNGEDRRSVASSSNIVS